MFARTPLSLCAKFGKSEVEKGSAPVADSRMRKTHCVLTLFVRDGLHVCVCPARDH